MNGKKGIQIEYDERFCDELKSLNEKNKPLAKIAVLKIYKIKGNPTIGRRIGGTIVAYYRRLDEDGVTICYLYVTRLNYLCYEVLKV